MHRRTNVMCVCVCVCFMIPFFQSVPRRHDVASILSKDIKERKKEKKRKKKRKSKKKWLSHFLTHARSRSLLHTFAFLYVNTQIQTFFPLSLYPCFRKKLKQKSSLRMLSRVHPPSLVFLLLHVIA